MKHLILLFCIASLLQGCTHKQAEDEHVPVIGFVDYVEDATLAEARKGFYDALADSGFSEEKRTIRILYRNAQGDQPTLLQAVDYLVSQKPVLIAANTTLATVASVQRNHDIPVYMLVAPRPDIAKLTDVSGKAPDNLHGVYETLSYIDSSVMMIHKLFPDAKTIGTIYNQAESQSVDALNILRNRCKSENLMLQELPVSTSAETQLVTQALIQKKPDVFFALPDNVIFSSFEVIAKACSSAHIPVLTSESGLVSRGALASYGADIYQWGYQSGALAAAYLRDSTKQEPPQEVSLRHYVYNPKVAAEYNITPSAEYQAIK